MAAHDDLIASAMARSALDDFGGDSFREGLEILVRSLRDEARLNPAGEALIYPRLVQHLVNRLEIEDWYRRHPEIDDVPIVAPLFGLSLPRTGSTALSFLLAQDPGVRYLRQWESSKPCPPPSTVDGPDPRVEEATGQAGIGTKDHVPSDVSGPMECLDLMALDFKTMIYQAFARIPAYADWVTDADLTSTYEYERRVLKLLQWGSEPMPWRLKSPAHMLWIDHLAAVFPDARFVMTHRDPTDVILSVCDVYADIGGVFTEHLDRAYIGRVNVEQWSTAINRVMRFRDEGGDDRFYDIDFRAMRSDPIGEVRRLYGWLGEPVTSTFESRMRHWWEANAADREPSEHSDPAAYGIDMDAVRPLFEEYVTRCSSWTAH
ncbi:MAG TPA: sulfotransferase [Acidimicrobiales bacterium]|nr:sulfotransferase [Acidimicrobiales bacterium]